MPIRLYNIDDYKAVSDLLGASYDYFPTKEGLGGIGVVMEEGGSIDGFAWALTSVDSQVAYVDYFFVRQHLRGKRSAGPMLMVELFRELIKNGKKIIHGIMHKSNEYSLPLLRIYKDLGMMISDKEYVVSGNVDEILEGLKGRYGN